MAELKIKADSGGGTVALKGPATTTSNAAVQLTLPVDDGTANQYLKTDGSGTLSWATVSSVGGATGVDFNDNVVTRWGTGNDLEIYHDGTNSSLKNSTGVLYARGSDVRITNAAADETMVKAVADGGVELYHDNVKKFETNSLGTRFYGRAYFDDDMTIEMGAAADLKIHHTSNVNHIRSHNGDLVIGTQNNHTTILGQYYGAAGGGDTLEIWGGANVVPATNDAVDLGETNHKWDDIYATNSSIQTSDQNNKDNITASDLGLSFINKLSPKSYKFKGKTRTHYGLIAQDIETVLGDISKPTADFAGFIKTPAPEQLYTERDQAHNRIPSGKEIGDVKLAAHTDYGLRYTEFIGPLVKAVQELSAEVETLKTKVAALEAG
mgnify:CR=1 FL=1